ncbi:MAG: urea ABC transporter permease subunit UrtC [Solirubrobacterales bacterium]
MTPGDESITGDIVGTDAANHDLTVDPATPPPAQNKWSGFARGQIGLILSAVVLLLIAPSLLSEFRLDLLAKYACFAMIAIGIDLAWGYGGMLVLGQGVFFGLGGYVMGMYMKLAEAGPGNLPDFMTWSGVEQLPLIWEPLKYAWIAIPLVVILPMLFAFLLGSLIFRRRVRGPYFAILSQALAAAFVILIIGQQGVTGGTNGLTNFTNFFGIDLNDTASSTTSLYYVAIIALGVCYVIGRQLVRSRFGRLLIASRDQEERVRFLGYNPATIKTIAYSAAAGMAGLAGALFVPIVGIISPALLGIVPSIEMVIWVAIGGRATLWGAVVGALVVSWAKTGLSEKFPSFWTYFLGLLFIVVVAYFPAGLAGLIKGGIAKLKDFRPSGPSKKTVEEPATEGAAG